jgi:hypothetical protein
MRGEGERERGGEEKVEYARAEERGTMARID